MASWIRSPGETRPSAACVAAPGTIRPRTSAQAIGIGERPSSASTRKGFAASGVLLDLVSAGFAVPPVDSVDVAVAAALLPLWILRQLAIPADGGLADRAPAQGTAPDLLDLNSLEGFHLEFREIAATEDGLVLVRLRPF